MHFSLLLCRYVVHYLESIFAVHCAIPTQLPTLIPVSNRSTASWLKAGATSRVNTIHRGDTELGDRSQDVDGTGFQNLLASARIGIGGPVFLDAEGVPVSLPDALHVGLARYFALLGIMNFRGYQVGKVYSPCPRNNPFRAADHPIESHQASFDIVSPCYQ